MLSNEQISQVKAYLAQGYKQHDIAAHYGVNGGRIAEIAKGKTGGDVKPAPKDSVLPLGKTQPRYFTNGQSLDEQVAIFTDLAKSSKNAPAHVHLITPQLAEWLLKNRHGGNRRPSAKSIDDYSEAMDEKDWPVTGATIVVGRSGNILDGQHRLIACIRSDTPFMTYVVFGVDDAAFTRIDTGRKRTNIDAFHIAGIPCASASARVIRWLRIFDEDPTDRSKSYTNDELLSWMRAKGNIDMKLFEECVSHAIAVKKDSKLHKCEMPEGQMGALLYLFAQKSRRDMVKFVDALRVGNKQPAISLYASIKKVKSESGGRVNEVLRNGRVIQAWNAHRENRRVSVASFNYTPTEHDYPEIV